MAYPSEAHLLEFGRHIHHYAQVESGIKIAVCGILGINLGDAMVAFQPYGAQDLKNVAKSLGKQRLKPEWSERFCWIVGEWSKHGALRNSIAHNRWTDGPRPNSIKPRYVSIREGKPAWFGDDLEELDYTPEDIRAAASDLHEINERLKAFLQESGIQALIEEKIAADNA